MSPSIAEGGSESGRDQRIGTGEMSAADQVSIPTLIELLSKKRSAKTSCQLHNGS